MTFDEIMAGIKIQESRKETKEIIHIMKRDGITLEEGKALYMGFIATNPKYMNILPLILLWIDEVYKEKDEM